MGQAHLRWGTGGRGDPYDGTTVGAAAPVAALVDRDVRRVAADDLPDHLPQQQVGTDEPSAIRRARHRPEA